MPLKMLNIDEEEAMIRTVVLNAPILNRSAGLSGNVFPKTYKIKNNWTAWAVALLGLLAVLSPKVIVPLMFGEPVFQVSLWGGWYRVFTGAYGCLCLWILLCRLPVALEREVDAFSVHFLTHKVRVPLPDLYEVRVVRKWMVEDSVKLAAKSAPGLLGPCAGSAHSYEEIGAPKGEKVKRCFPFSLCEPFFCCDASTKFYWGAPGMFGREVCILTVKNSTCNNYVFDLADGQAFIQDNRADYSHMVAGRPAAPVQMGMGLELKSVPLLNSLESATEKASPLESIALPIAGVAPLMSASTFPLESAAGMMATSHSVMATTASVAGFSAELSAAEACEP